MTASNHGESPAGSYSKNGSFSEVFPKISTGNKQRPWGLLGTNFASEIHLHLN